MKKASVWCLSLAVVCGSFGFGLPIARAIPPFKKEFDLKYVKKDGTEQEKSLAALVDKAKCNVCHIKGKNKKERNAYGEALAGMLDKKEDEKNVDKIREALDKAAQMKSDPESDNSPTFGQIIAEGKLPGGNDE